MNRIVSTATTTCIALSHWGLHRDVRVAPPDGGMRSCYLRDDRSYKMPRGHLIAVGRPLSELLGTHPQPAATPILRTVENGGPATNTGWTEFCSSHICSMNVLSTYSACGASGTERTKLGSTLSKFDSVGKVRQTRDGDTGGAWDWPNDIVPKSRWPDSACVCRPSKDEEWSSGWPSDTRDTGRTHAKCTTAKAWGPIHG